MLQDREQCLESIEALLKAGSVTSDLLRDFIQLHPDVAGLPPDSVADDSSLNSSLDISTEQPDIVSDTRNRLSDSSSCTITITRCSSDRLAELRTAH